MARTKKRQIDWSTDETQAKLWWHNGGSLPGETRTARSRGVWITATWSCGKRSWWLARSWQGAYDRMTELGYLPHDSSCAECGTLYETTDVADEDEPSPQVILGSPGFAL